VAGGRLASFGEIAGAAGCLCGYPCWMSYLAILNMTPQAHFIEKMKLFLILSLGGADNTSMNCRV
jgi:hypothetical protein